MSKLSKFFALAIILAFIASVPLALAQTQPDAVQVVIVLKHDENFANPDGGSGVQVLETINSGSEATKQTFQPL